MSEPFQPKPIVQGGVVQYGKYAGQYIEDLPTEYLVWFCQHEWDRMVERRAWAKDELKRRGIKVAK